ncbi:MAG TPA: CDP-alcohol phosphatidyltransferase family protein [Rhizomicrobium sp.]|jgi:phosphatidylglycerophosphate synthase|nr:CDP-alcohol phosphatidyltransferase family protein [Rhizomicrobium sp.]
MDTENRRPLKSRSSGWARVLATTLARLGVSPDFLSALSVVFALGGAACFVLSATPDDVRRAALLIGAAVCIQLRLLCNLLDGMVAVEHGKGSSAGPIWNELPDRIADVCFLVGAGYACELSGWAGASVTGWIAAIGALLTAYVRELGRGLGFAADFCGPMAKPHRMALLTGASVLAAAEPLWGWRGQTLLIALALIALGAVITAARRTQHLAQQLAARAK